MEGVDWKEFFLAAIGLMTAGAIYLRGASGHSKSDGKPPRERAPEPHEVRQSLDSIKTQINRVGLDDEAAEQLKRAIVKLSDVIEVHRASLDRNTAAASTISERMSTVTGAIEELAKEMEFTSRLGGRTPAPRGR